MSWHIGLATGACTHRTVLDILPAIAASGVTGVEISTPPWHFDPWRPNEVVRLADALGGTRLQAVSIHAPFGGRTDMAHPDAGCRDRAIDGAAMAIEVMATLGGGVVVVHPSDLERSHHSVDARLADATASLNRVADLCRGRRVTLAVESPLPHLIGGHPSEFQRLLASLDDSVRVCLDVGHTTLGDHWHDFVAIAGPRTVHVHAHDNHGHRDDHLPPGQGRVDWRDIGRSLEAIGFAGWIVLELLCGPGDSEAYFHGAVERARQLLAPPTVVPLESGASPL